MKRTSPARTAPSLSLAPSSSLPLDGPYCLPCVTRAHIFSYLFSSSFTSSRTPGLARKSMYPRDRECSPFLDITLAHLQVSSLSGRGFYHSHTHEKTEAHTHADVRTHARRSRAHATLCLRSRSVLLYISAIASFHPYFTCNDR
jgi:hypothetical protein